MLDVFVGAGIAILLRLTVDDLGTYVLVLLLMGEVTVDWLRVCEVSKRFVGERARSDGRLTEGGGPILELGRL